MPQGDKAGDKPGDTAGDGLGHRPAYIPANYPRIDNPLRGIVLSLLASTVFAVSDSTSKFLTESMPVVEIAWIRYMIFVIFCSWLARSTDLRALWPRSPALQMLRGLCVVGSAVLFVFGIRSMQIAQASTISFISPLLITVLSIPILGEVVGLRRWAATAAGMLGVIIVARPATGGFQPAALFGVASSACWALALVITRKMATTERSSTTLAWTAGIGAVVLTVWLPWVFVLPSVPHVLLALVVGVLSSTGQWLTVLSIRLAPASLLAPFSYSQLVWATLAGWLVFHNLPDAWTLVGAAIIIASGLYTAHRERLRARGARPRLARAEAAERRT
jgi:drug/metabolite transporter (DMT)-like permease